MCRRVRSTTFVDVFTVISGFIILVSRTECRPARCSGIVPGLAWSQLGGVSGHGRLGEVAFLDWMVMFIRHLEVAGVMFVVRLEIVGELMRGFGATPIEERGWIIEHILVSCPHGLGSLLSTCNGAGVLGGTSNLRRRISTCRMVGETPRWWGGRGMSECRRTAKIGSPLITSVVGTGSADGFRGVGSVNIGLIAQEASTEGIGGGSGRMNIRRKCRFRRFLSCRRRNPAGVGQASRYTG